MLKRALIGILVVCFTGSAYSQDAAGTTDHIVKGSMTPAEMDRIIKKVTANEAAFREALTNYVFTRDAVVSTVGMGGNITGVSTLR